MNGKTDHYNWEKPFPNDFIDLNETDLNHPHFVPRHRVNQDYGSNAILQTFPNKYSYMPEWQQREQQLFDNRRNLKETSIFSKPRYIHDWNMSLKTEPYRMRRNDTTEIQSSHTFHHTLRGRVKRHNSFPHKNKYEMDRYTNKQISQRSYPDFHTYHRDFYGNHFLTQEASGRNSDFQSVQNYTNSKDMWENRRIQTVDTQSFNHNAPFNKPQIHNSTQPSTDCDKIIYDTGINADLQPFATDLQTYCSSDECTTSITSSNMQTNDNSNSPFITVQFPSTNEVFNLTNEKISTQSTTEKEVSTELENSLGSMDETALSVYYLQNLYPSLEAENSIPDLNSDSQLVLTNKISVLEDKESDQIINDVYFDSDKSTRASGTKLKEKLGTNTEEINKFQQSPNKIDHSISTSFSEKADNNSVLTISTACNSVKNSDDLIIFNANRCSTNLDEYSTMEIKDMHSNILEVVPIEQEINLEFTPVIPTPANPFVNNSGEELNYNKDMSVSLEMKISSLLDSEISSNQVEASVIHTEDSMAEESTLTEEQCDELGTLIDSPVCEVNTAVESNGFKIQQERLKTKCKKKRKSKDSSSASDATYSCVSNPEELFNPKKNCLSSLTNNVFDEQADIKYHNDVVKLESFDFPESASKNSNCLLKQKIVKRRRKCKKNVNYSTKSILESRGSIFMYSNILDSNISLDQIETSLSSITNYLLDEPTNFKLDDEKLELDNLRCPLVSSLYSSKKSVNLRRTRVPIRQKKVRECHIQSNLTDPFLSSTSVINLSSDLLDEMFEPSSPEYLSDDGVRKSNRGKKRKKFSRNESELPLIQKYAKPISIHDRSDFCQSESSARDDDFVKMDNLRQVLKEFCSAKVEKEDACTQISESDLSPIMENKCDAQTQWNLSDVKWSDFSPGCELVDEVDETANFPKCREKIELCENVAPQEENIERKIYWELRTRQTTSCSQNKQHLENMVLRTGLSMSQSKELGHQECLADSDIEEGNEKLKSMVKTNPLENENMPHKKEASNNVKIGFRKVKVKIEEISPKGNVKTRERRCKKIPQNLRCQNQQRNKSVKFKVTIPSKAFDKSTTNARNTKISKSYCKRYSLRKRKM